MKTSIKVLSMSLLLSSFVCSMDKPGFWQDKYISGAYNSAGTICRADLKALGLNVNNESKKSQLYELPTAPFSALSSKQLELPDNSTYIKLNNQGALLQGLLSHLDRNQSPGFVIFPDGTVACTYRQDGESRFLNPNNDVDAERIRALCRAFFNANEDLFIRMCMYMNKQNRFPDPKRRSAEYLDAFKKENDSHFTNLSDLSLALEIYKSLGCLKKNVSSLSAGKIILDDQGKTQVIFGKK